ncbi:ComEA family DNA-binding protein [Streptomyces sp. NBC_00140]|uniref:ComEA family DNA-binding protein n=1 Tax=Streptomyces sp. NBC_00140 TaxID=2975664 RepID=UPI00225613B9|nr:ComEA family DNA-binding protein [Streptomyces sp. NBC_00140]MCX5334155.1 ComEA family DNA-binding protein [Streptomyces sp. NBC_00140]
MALRSRSRTATSTSGPGRGPASDVRTRHHQRHHRPSRGRHRYASAEELRRRAEVMFADRVGERREAGTGPPGLDGDGVPGSGADGIGADADFGPDAGPAPVGWADVPPATGDRRVRAGLALRERMPVWLQVRCGLERRSVVALAVVLVVAAGFAVQHFWAGRTQAVRAPEVVAAPFAERSAEAGPGASAGAPGAVGSPVAEIVVDVGGKVRDPGVHRLPAGSRVADALRAAGGVRPGTDTEGLNRARFLIDGEQVVVGGPAAPGAGPGGTAGGGPVGSAGSVPGAGPAAPVPLNTATVDQLDTLPGVGPVLAQHIVDYRTQHGGFRSVDELREVNGIGERRFADLRNLVRP